MDRLAIAIVGESPEAPAIDPRTERSSEPLGGMVGMRLSLLCGCSVEEYLAAFSRCTLLPRWPGKKWPWAEAAVRGREVLAQRRLPTVLLGRRVACAVLGEAGGHAARWYAPAGAFVVAPSPMGKLGLWRERAELERARAFWSGLYREAARLASIPDAVGAA